MDPAQFPVDMMTSACFMLLMLLNSNRALVEFAPGVDEDEVMRDGLLPASVDDTNAVAVDICTQAALHHFRLLNSHFFLDEDLGYWMKPHSTT